MGSISTFDTISVPLTSSPRGPHSDEVILDASNSQDDLGPEGLTYLWEEVSGPLDSQEATEGAVLALQNLKAGLYKFK